MSKNLEKEYREYTDRNAPDLWERIKSGLEEKGAAEESGISAEGLRSEERILTAENGIRKERADKGNSLSKEALSVIEGGIRGKKEVRAGRLRRRRYRIWGAAAVCLCLAVTGVGLKNRILPGQEMGAESLIGDQLSGGEMNGEASGGKPLDEEGNNFEAMEGAAGMEAGQEGASLIPEEDGMDWNAMDSAINSVAKPNQVWEMPREDAAAGEPMVGEEIRLVALQIEITSVTEQEGKRVYTAEIRNSEELSLQAGDGITLYDGRSDERALEEGGVYEIYASERTETGGEKKYQLIEIKENEKN